MLPDGSDGQMRRLRYTGPGAVLVTAAHERIESRGPLGGCPADAARTAGGACSRSGAGDRARARRPACGSGEAVKPPIGFVYGNCVFADALDDGWAAFAVRDGVLRVALRGRQARAVPRAARRAGGDRGRRADPARRAALGPRALRARAGKRRSAQMGAGTDDRHARAQRRYAAGARRAPERDRRGAAGAVPDREPARSRARRRRLRLARRRAPSARVVGGDQARLLGARPARAEGRRAGARAGARRPGARAPGGLPAGPPGARGGAAVAGAQGLLPRPGRAGGRRAARAAGAGVRAQRRGDAGAAGGRRDALDGRLRRASRAGAADRVGAGHELAGAAGRWARCPSGRSSRARAWS